MAKSAVVVEIEWLDRGHYTWHVLHKHTYDSVVNEDETCLANLLDQGQIETLAKFGGPDTSFDDEADRSEAWCNENGFQVVDTHEEAAEG